MTNMSRRTFLEALTVSATWTATQTRKVTARQQATARAQSDTAAKVGVAKVDITPDYPVRLSGFGFRKTESEGVTHRIWAKALAIDLGGRSPAVLVAVDNLGVPDKMVVQLASDLQRQAGIDPACLAVTSTHTHTAPMLSGVAPTLFGEPIPPPHQAHIDQYTEDLAVALEQVSLAALKDRSPADLEWGLGAVGFGMNRRATQEGRVVGIGRNPAGPVDHDLPLLVVKTPSGKIRAVYTSYACHCVTLSNNKISGDWAGFAQSAIEQQFPDATALVSVGCGADINPDSGVMGDKVAVAAGQGQQIADEVTRLIDGGLSALAGPLIAQQQRVNLMFDTHPTRDEWQRRASLPKDTFHHRAIAYHAQRQLDRLDQGEALQTHISYPIQTWSFGDHLAIVFLPGEVVVDYSRRLKREFDSKRLWVNGYANDVPCYIPSERVLQEGGYEGGDAMRYFDRPTRFQPGLEQQIIDIVHRQLEGRFTTG